VGWAALAAGILILAAGYATDLRHAVVDNIIAFLMLLSVGLGAMFLIAIEYLTGAVWSVPMRRVTEALGSVIVAALLVAFPVLTRLHDAFAWTNEKLLAAETLLAHKAPYLNVSFFLLRFALFFVLWLLFYWLLRRNSLKQDTTKDQTLTKKNIRLSAAFLPVFALTITFTAIDWAMSLEPRWYSTIFGVYFFSGAVLTVLAVLTYAVIRLVEKEYLPKLGRNHYYNLGVLLFVFTNFWAYIAFSQFMLTWYANLPEETFWFVRRWDGAWMWVSIGLIIVRFAVPYFVLLSQDAKTDAKRLKFMAIWIVAGQFVDLYWLTMPTVHPEVTLSWIDLGVPLLFTGAVLLLLKLNIERHSAVPTGDPKLQRGLDFHL
jgi:hypothetical protein